VGLGVEMLLPEIVALGDTTVLDPDSESEALAEVEEEEAVLGVGVVEEEAGVHFVVGSAAGVQVEVGGGGVQVDVGGGVYLGLVEVLGFGCSCPPPPPPLLPSLNDQDIWKTPAPGS
jgi:hypothetical protein